MISKAANTPSPSLGPHRSATPSAAGHELPMLLNEEAVTTMSGLLDSTTRTVDTEVLSKFAGFLPPRVASSGFDRRIAPQLSQLLGGGGKTAAPLSSRTN